MIDSSGKTWSPFCNDLDLSGKFSAAVGLSESSLKNSAKLKPSKNASFSVVFNWRGAVQI